MKLQAILFDLDGILADSETMWNEIDGALLRHYGVEYSGQYKHEVLGTNFPTAMKIYADRFGLRTDLEEMALRRHVIAEDFYANHIPIFPAAPRVLEELSRDFALGLATSCISALVLPFLKRHDIGKFLSAVTTGEEVENSKPHPDIYLRTAQKLHVAPENCVVVEDAIAGVQSGRAAGMTVVAIPDPRFMDVSLYPGQADYILRELAELPDLIGRIHTP